MNEEKLKRSIFEHMDMYWHNITSRAVAVEYSGYFEIVVTVEDGTRYLYNDLDEAIRRLPDRDTMTEEECLREFGYRLSNIMRCKGFTQEILSEMTGISQARISNYIRGKVSPGFYIIDKIARALNCPVDDLRYF